MSLVSIITPAYNASKFIAQTIKCVQTQTHANWEMIIIDDGSTDNMSEIIKPFLVDERIKYFYQDNGKQSKARNHALKYAKGEYLAFLDADDLWVPNKLEMQLNVFENNNVDLVYSQGYIFTDTIDNKVEADTLTGYSQLQFLKKLLVANRIAILSVMVKAKKVKEVGNFNEHPKIQNAEDYHLWLKLADNGCKFFGMEERLYYYRRYSQQSSNDLIMAIVCEIWAINIISFKTIDDRFKKQIMDTRINRAFLLNLNEINDLKLSQILSLYLNPLHNNSKYFALKLVSLFGKNILNKFSYRILNLNLKFNKELV